MAIPFTFKNEHIDNAMAKTWDVLGRYTSPYCSISGGSDSDVMLDLVYRMDTERRVSYIWFNTGLEFAATKRHLDYLEDEYKIKIERITTHPSIPVVVRKYGVPFVSKFVAGCIDQLQRYDFDFTAHHNLEDDKRQFRDCITAVYWWHNNHKVRMWNINYNLHLKEFLRENPPKIRISNQCCHFTKKKTGEQYRRETNRDLRMLGLRKSEGGIRQMINSCFSHSDKMGDVYRPIYWFTDKDKAYYLKEHELRLSDCYTVYGMKRTGCVGCPFNLRLFEELRMIEDHEPGLLKAAQSIFGASYEYTRQFREYQVAHSPDKRFRFALTQ